MLRSFGVFVLAALAELGGAYAVWQWARGGGSILLAALGAGSLFFYAWLQTIQPFNFGRAFAAYGGVFIVTALVWGWLVDGHSPDWWESVGAFVCLIGAAIIAWMPR